MVGLVLGEQQRDIAVAVEEVLRKRFLQQRYFGRSRVNGCVAGERRARKARLGATALPRPGVAKPQRRQDVNRCRLGSAVAHADPDQNVIGRRFGVLDEHVEVSVVVENARVEQLVLGFVLAAAAVGRDEVAVRIRGLRILVQVLHVRVRRRRVEVEVVLLDVLAVIALAVGQPEGAFLEDRVLSVPQRERET